MRSLLLAAFMGAAWAAPTGTEVVPDSVSPVAVAPTAFPTDCGLKMRYTYTVDSAWQLVKIGGSMRQVRSIIFDNLGTMLVLQATSGLTAHTFGANGCINSSTTVVSNPALNHGLALSPDNKKVYVSSETTAWVYDYDPTTKKGTNGAVIVKNMATGVHSTRAIVVPPANPNVLLLQIGSNNNWDYDAINPSTGRAMIKSFDLTAVPSGGYNYNTQGTNFAYGLRNEIGLIQDPAGMLWGVENSGDDFRRTENGQSYDIHTDDPAEKLNYFGDPTTPQGKWYGYPTCFSVWSGSSFKDGTHKTGDQFVVSPNNTFNDASCVGKSTPPRLTFQAHSAPIGGAFDSAGTNLYVSFHGSWDRQPPTGFSVVQIPFQKTANGTYDPVAAADSNTGYKTIMQATSPASCTANGLTQSNCFRLTAVQWDPQGTRMFIGSDNSNEGEIYVMAKKS